jgi:hypothetical protein
LTFAPAASAAIIWDNGGPDQLQLIGSDFEFPFQLGDNFTLGTAATAGQIQWWGGYAGSNTPTGPDNFTIRLFTITAGVPSTVPLFSYAVGNSVGRVDSGLNAGAIDIYSYTATIPDTLLASGDYLLSIVNNTAADTDDNWYWATSSQSGATWERASDGQTWNFRNNKEFAFNIGGTAVPEPGTNALLFIGFGLVGLFLVQRRLANAAETRT